MRGPRNMGPRPKVKKGTLMRVLKYMMQTYWIHMILVVIFIITNAVCTLQGTLFMQKLIDVYILPMINTGSRDFAPLAAALRKLAAILLLGIFSAYAYNRIMVTVGQGTMEKIRVELFSHMQTLPIKYFDTHAHGDIMSVYTNDIDTMRQVISQTIPTIAIAPLLVLWMGFGVAPKIALVVITTFFPIAVGLLDGFKSADRDAVSLLRSMNATRWQIFRHVKFPAALPYFFSGLKISASYAVVGAVISEWLGGFEGLGVYMTRVRKAYAFDKMFAVIILVVIVSLLLMRLVNLLRTVSMPWLRKQPNLKKQ